MTDEEIQRHLPVWSALSELFLDTDLDDGDYWSIAQRAASTGIPVQELHDILVNDVFPRFAFNLFNVAGDWQPWSDRSVRDVMLGPKPGPVPRLISRLLHGKNIEKEWQRVLQAMEFS